MEMTRHLDIEGASLDIPLRYDDFAGGYIEVYASLIENPVRTPEGRPILFIGEDACPYCESSGEEPCVDCGSCRFYRRTPGTLIGVCGSDANLTTTEGVAQAERPAE